MARRIPQRHAVAKLRELLACQYPFAYCDACLAFHLGVNLADAKAASTSVSANPGYSRQRRDCYGCGRILELTAMSRKKLLP